MAKLEGIEDRKGTEYLLSDEKIDVGVQIGLYAVSWLVEASRLVKRSVAARKESRGSSKLPETPHNDGLAMSRSVEDKAVANA